MGSNNRSVKILDDTTVPYISMQKALNMGINKVFWILPWKVM